MLRDYIELPLSVRILCLGTLINRAGSFVLIFLAIYASEQLGFGVPFATACIGVLGAGAMLGSLLGGHLADKVGRRVVMLVAMFGGGALLMLLSQMTSRGGFMLTVGAFAMVADLYRPAASAMIGDLVSKDRRSHAFALLYISVNLGFSIAPPVGGLLAGFSFQWLFWIDALTMIGYGLIILFSIAESRPPRVTTRFPAASDESVDTAIPFTRAMRHMIQDQPFMLFCLSQLLIAMVFVQASSTLPIYVRQNGFSNVQFGLMMSINGVMIVVLQLPLTHWLSRFNAMSVVVVGGFLISLGFGLTAWHGGLLMISISIAVWTLGEIIEAPFKQSIVTDMAPEALRGRYLGLLSMCYALALMMGAPLGGEILHRYGAMTLWISAGALAMLGVALYAFIHAPISVRIAITQQPGVAEVGETTVGDVQLGDIQLGDVQQRSA